MKIAIASDDEKNISSHFGRTKVFVIFELQGNVIISKDYRINNFGHHQHRNHDENYEYHSHNYRYHRNNEHRLPQHSHNEILDILSDCEVVISKGMGKRLYIDLENAQKKIFVTNIDNVDNANNEFINGNLKNYSENCCEH